MDDKTQDARSLSAAEQEGLRRRVIRALRRGMKPAEAARAFGISRTAVWNWRQRVGQGDLQALRSKPRGRPRRSRLEGTEAMRVVRMISRRCPDQLKLPFALWTREAVQKLLIDRFGLDASVWTVGRYIEKWGMMPERPVRRAYEKNPKAIQEWLNREYPGIRARAKRDRASIHWLDCGSVSARLLTSGARRPGADHRAFSEAVRRVDYSMISTMTNHGHLSFMLHRGRLNVSVMIRFLDRLIRQSRRNVVLIVDPHLIGNSTRLTRWYADHACHLKMILLPAVTGEPSSGERAFDVSGRPVS